MSIHRVSAATRLKGHPVTAQIPRLLENDTPKLQDEQMKKTSVRVIIVLKSPSEYAADRIIEHKGRSQDKKYIFRWYGYGSEVNTLEIAK